MLVKVNGTGILHNLGHNRYNITYVHQEHQYREVEVQQNFTPEMEVFYMIFERCHTKNRKRSLNQHIKTE